MTQKSQKILSGFLLFLLPIAIAFGQDSETLSSIDRIVTQIETMYPRVEGLVVSLEGNDILIDLKEGDPIRPGDRLNLVRYGEEILHPVTQKKLGRKETQIGEVEIIQIGKNFSRARTTDKTVKVQVGDGVQPAFSKISFLIAPIESKTDKTVDTTRLGLALEKRLKANPRFDVPAFDLGVWMLESGISPDQLLQQKSLNDLREKVKTDLILIPSLREIKGKTVLSYEMASAVDGKIKGKAEVLSDSLPALPPPTRAKKSKEQAVATDFENENKGVLEYVSKQEFPFEIVDFDVGDIYGDGELEYVIIDRYRVMIYKVENGKLKQIAQHTSNKSGSRFLAVDMGDINGNGRDEIFVTNQSGNELKSFVLEINPDKKQRLDKIWENVRLYFRIIRPFGEKPKLLAQGSGFLDPFTGGIKTVQFQGNGYVVGSEISLPPVQDMKFTLYGLTQTNISSSKTNETIILDKDYHLRVYSPGGRLLVKSDEYYGHDPRLVDTGVKDDPIGGVKRGEPANFKGRLQFVQHGGKRFLFLPKNYLAGGGLLSKLIIVNDSNLVILGVSEEGFSKYAETKKQKGYIASYQIVDVPKTNETRVHAVAVQEGGLTGKTISTFFTYNWRN